MQRVLNKFNRKVQD